VCLGLYLYNPAIFFDVFKLLKKPNFDLPKIDEIPEIIPNIIPNIIPEILPEFGLKIAISEPYFIKTISFIDLNVLRTMFVQNDILLEKALNLTIPTNLMPTFVTYCLEEQVPNELPAYLNFTFYQLMYLTNEHLSIFSENWGNYLLSLYL